MEYRETVYKTPLGDIRGLDNGRCLEFRGVPFGRAGRFEYAEPVESWEGVLDATRFGPGCPQNRAVHEHLEDPVRLFYKKEYREGSVFSYAEDCLNLNIYAPYGATNAPVILFFYGGGFDSGLNAEDPFDGSGWAKRGAVAVVANYRVGPLGYLTHEEIQKRYGRDGNFGLDDQLTAIRWVKQHIGAFGGDGENLTLLGQSAGAISIQYLCLNPAHRGLFRRAAMMSGGGLFPRFALPRDAESTRAYWLQFMELMGCRTFDELKAAPLTDILDAVEKIKALRKDTVYHTMPVVDGTLLPGPVDKLIHTPLPVDYLIGFTNNDMYAPLMAHIGCKFGRQNGAYLYCFDLDAPGDDNRAFHSADLRYMFGTLDRSWRPYGQRDFEASEQMMDYLVNFARTGDPNGAGLPLWKRGKPALRIGSQGTRMGPVPYGKLIRNMLTKGDPKA